MVELGTHPIVIGENAIMKTIKFKSKWEKIDSLRLDEIDDHEIITAKFNNTHLGMILLPV